MARSTARLLWVIALSTAALIVFHELGARMGIVTGKRLLALVRERLGARGATVALGALVVANLGTLSAEFAGVAAGFELRRRRPLLSVPLAALGVSLLVLRRSFHRVEHVLLALTGVFVAYILSGFLAHPDRTATAKGLVVPGMPLTREAVLVAVATLGTTLTHARTIRRPKRRTHRQAAADGSRFSASTRARSGPLGTTSLP